jgi:hypothetical protein
MKKIYSTENKVIIYLIQAKLADQGINCIMKNESPPLAGEIPPVMAWPELWVVDDKNYSQAIDIVQQEIAFISKSKNPWSCKKCGENLEGQFDACWKCGSCKS